jgi:hypothetical protein
MHQFVNFPIYTNAHASRESLPKEHNLKTKYIHKSTRLRTFRTKTIVILCMHSILKFLEVSKEKRLFLVKTDDQMHPSSAYNIQSWDDQAKNEEKIAF